MNLPKCKRVHVMSVSQGPLKLMLEVHKLMLEVQLQSSIVLSSRWYQFVGPLVTSNQAQGESAFYPSSLSFLCHFNFVYVMFCVRGPNGWQGEKTCLRGFPT